MKNIILASIFILFIILTIPIGASQSTLVTPKFENVTSEETQARNGILLRHIIVKQEASIIQEEYFEKIIEYVNETYEERIPYKEIVTVEIQEVVTREDVVTRERTVPQERFVRETEDVVNYTDRTLADTSREFAIEDYIVVSEIILRPKDRIKFNISVTPGAIALADFFEFLIVDLQNYNLWLQNRAYTAYYSTPSGGANRELSGFWTVPDDAPIQQYRIIISNRGYRYAKRITYEIVYQEATITQEERLVRVIEEVTETYEEVIPRQEIVTVTRQEYVTKEKVVTRERTVPQERLVPRVRDLVKYEDTTLADGTVDFSIDNYIVIAEPLLKPKDRIKFSISTDPRKSKLEREFEFLILDNENYNLWLENKVYKAYYKSPQGTTEISGYWTVPDYASAQHYKIVVSNRDFAYSRRQTITEQSQTEITLENLSRAQKILEISPQERTEVTTKIQENLRESSQDLEKAAEKERYISERNRLLALISGDRETAEGLQNQIILIEQRIEKIQELKEELVDEDNRKAIEEVLYELEEEKERLKQVSMNENYRGIVGFFRRILGR